MAARCSATRRARCGRSWIAPDEENRIPLACRCLLVEALNGKTVLFETGIGAFFEPKLRERYGVVEDRHVLLESLHAAGFDARGHRRGRALAPAFRPCRRPAGAHGEKGEPPSLLFPNATYRRRRGMLAARAQSASARPRFVHRPNCSRCWKPAAGWSCVEGDALADAGHGGALSLPRRPHAGADAGRNRRPARGERRRGVLRRPDSRAGRGCTCRSRWATTAIRNC